MTTVVDPLGSPSVTYNMSGTAIVSVVGGPKAGGGPIGDDAVPIPRVCQTTVALVVSGFSGALFGLVRLPEDAEVGDLVEVYQDPVSTESYLQVFPNIGESIGGGYSRPASTGTNSAAGCAVDGVHGGAAFRKVSSTLWMPIGAI
jgi:hypothetical protein